MKLFVILAALVGAAFAVSADQSVRGHVRSDGTYVAPYFRSNSNSYRWDNHSSQGNRNPYAGARGYGRHEFSNPSMLAFSAAIDSYRLEMVAGHAKGINHFLGRLQEFAVARERPGVEAGAGQVMAVAAARKTRSTAASFSDYVPLAAVSGNMLLYKYAPEAFDQEELLKRVARQVDYDQRYYGHQTRYGKPPGGDRSTPLFSQEEVAGRKPDFAARDLLDTYRTKLDQIASGLPTRYSGVIAVEDYGGPQYDHSRGVLHKKFETGYLLKQLVKTHVPEIEDRVLYDFDRTARGVSSSLAMQLRNKFGYRIYDKDELIPPETPASMTRIVTVPLPRSNDGAGTELVLALDRLLDVPAFPLDSRAVERMLTPPTHTDIEQTKKYLGTFLFFFDLEIEDILISGRHYVVKANVLGAKLLGTRGELLKNFAPSDLPSAAALHAKRKAEREAKRAAVDDEQRKKAEVEMRKQAEQQAAEQAEQTRLDETREALRNADIVGIRLGMNMSEAEKIIRRHMDVGWVARSPDKAPTGLEPNRPYSHFKTFISTDGGKQIALFWHPDISDRIVAVTRTLPLAEGSSREAVVAQLLDKYGDQPAKKDDSSVVCATLRQSLRV